MTSSPPDSAAGRKPGGPYRKPQADIYTVLLAFALVFILLGILCLYFENNIYEWKYEGAPTVSTNHPSAPALANHQRAGPGHQESVVRSSLTAYPPLIPDP